MQALLLRLIPTSSLAQHCPRVLLLRKSQSARLLQGVFSRSEQVFMKTKFQPMQMIGQFRWQTAAPSLTLCATTLGALFGKAGMTHCVSQQAMDRPMWQKSPECG
jgi:hypothetical protein